MRSANRSLVNIHVLEHVLLPTTEVKPRGRGNGGGRLDRCLGCKLRSFPFQPIFRDCPSHKLSMTSHFLRLVVGLPSVEHNTVCKPYDKVKQPPSLILSALGHLKVNPLTLQALFTSRNGTSTALETSFIERDTPHVRQVMYVTAAHIAFPRGSFFTLNSPLSSTLLSNKHESSCESIGVAFGKLGTV